MYNPFQLEKEFDQVEHGKSRIAAIRSAIRQADENHDLMYQLAFRLELCYESLFYDDTMDMLIVFPEALALVDEHPDIPTTPGNEVYINGVDRLLEVYKWLVEQCVDYYQVSYKDCLNFFEDFKQRCLAFGYNLKPYYNALYSFYDVIDKEYATECFLKYRKLPTDGNGDCKACDRNTQIKYYLKRDNLKKANQLAVDIENFTLTCRGNDNADAWMRMKANYMNYYIRKKEYEKAETYIQQIERKHLTTKKTEYDYWDDYLRCYTYTDIGKALRIYKEHWKKEQKERCPATRFYMDKAIYIFFSELAKQHKSSTIKLDLDNSFPLYAEDGVYQIADMQAYYYNSAKNLAQKFDQRNGSDYYQKNLDGKEW